MGCKAISHTNTQASTHSSTSCPPPTPSPLPPSAFLAVCLPTILTTATGYRASNAGVLHIPTILKSFFVGAVDAFKPRSGRGALYSAALAPLALAWPLMTFTDLHPLVQGG